MKYLIDEKQEGVVFRFICYNALKKHCGMEFNDSFYNGLNYKFNNIKFGKILKNSPTVGNCYYYALLLATAMTGSVMQIGVLNELNSNYNDCYYREFGHAWVEKDGYVYDTTARVVFEKNFYYSQFDAEVLHTYKNEELQEPSKFFQLGVHAIKDRPLLIDNLFEISHDKLQDINFSQNYVYNCLKNVKNPDVFIELNAKFKPLIEKNKSRI